MKKTIILCLLALLIPFAAHAARFVDNKDGTVTDNRTGLMWQNTEANINDTKTWKEALEYCENLTLPVGGYTDWRLPTFKELASLVDLSTYDPAIDPIFEQYTVSSWYWSSTTNASLTYYAWSVNFDSGGGYNLYYYKSDSRYVRAVRGGQSGSGSLDHLEKVVLILKLLSGFSIEHVADISDVNGDDLIGLEEAIHALQEAAGLR